MWNGFIHFKLVYYRISYNDNDVITRGDTVFTEKNTRTVIEQCNTVYYQV